MTSASEVLAAKTAGVIGNAVRNTMMAAPLLAVPGAVAGHQGTAHAFGTPTIATPQARLVENAGGVAGGVGGLSAGMLLRRKAQGK